MRKGIILTMCLGLLFVTAGPGFAIPVKWDVSTAGAPAFGDVDTLTGLFNQMGFDSQTSTIQFDTDASGDVTVGDKFLDAGDLRVNGLIAPGIIDTEGLNQFGGYELTAKWTDVEGFVNSISLLSPTNTQLGLTYTSGTIDFYLDPALDSVFGNIPGTTPPSGAGGAGFDDGTKVATLSLITGIGNTFLDFTGNDLANQGSVELLLEFTYMLDGFWLDEFGNDLEDLDPITWNLLTTDMNIDTPNQNPGVPMGALYTAYSNQNGSAELTVVPEPSTMLLLGCGLVGLFFVSRKRSRQ